MAEELTGFPKLWDLEDCRSLPEKVQEACRKTLRGSFGTDFRGVPSTASSVERRPCVLFVVVCVYALLTAS